MNSLIKPIAILGGVCLILSPTLFSLPVQAGTLITTYPGTECVESNDTTSELIYLGGNAYNDAAGANTFVCPVASNYLSVANTFNYFNGAYWYASVDDRNGSANVSCYLRTCSADGSPCTNSPSRTSGGTGVQTLSTVGSIFNIRSYENYAYLTCTVPGKSSGLRSGIISYTIYRFDQ